MKYVNQKCEKCYNKIEVSWESRQNYYTVDSTYRGSELQKDSVWKQIWAQVFWFWSYITILPNETLRIASIFSNLLLNCNSLSANMLTILAFLIKKM